MRPASLFLRVPRLLIFAVLFTGSLAASSQTTAITGRVLAPYDATNNPNPDPLPHVAVFIPYSTADLADFSSSSYTGVTGGCNEQKQLLLNSPTKSPVVITTTDASGNFTLTGPALTSLPSGTYDLVIQAGKWRRQTMVTLSPGATVPLGNLNMPANSSQGDLPKIAVVTGEADSIECIFHQIGISDSEVTDMTGSGRINLFPASDSKNAGANAVGYSGANESTLMNSYATLQDYDMLMLGCTGYPTDTIVTEAGGQSLTNLANYANSGGRVFATHYEYIWLNKPSTFSGAADWRPDEGSITPIGGTGTIQLDQTNPDYGILSQWLSVVGISNNGTIPGVGNLRQDQTGVISPTQSWGTLEGPYDKNSGTVGTPIMQFTFDTPLNAATTGAVVSLAFTHSPTSFQTGDQADHITLTATNTSTTNATGLTLAITLPSALTATAITPQAGSGWTCSVSTLYCSGYLLAGASVPIAITVAVPSTDTPGSVSVSASLSGANLSTGNAECGRVLFNEYHDETTSSAAQTYPAECTKANANASIGAEKFLEYSLYNLSNFISPTDTDTIQIQEVAPVTWSPNATYPYGTPKSAIQTASSTIAGQWTYTYTPAANDPPDVLTGGANYTVVANFTPTDTTDYLGSSLTRLLSITPDQTDAIISNLENPIYYGEEIGYDTRPGIGLGDAILGVYITAGYTPWIGATPATGPYSLTLAGKVVCTGTEETGINDPSRQTACPDSNFQGYDVGQYAMQLTYLGNNDYISSISNSTIVVVNPDPTAASLALSNPGSVVHDTVTATATIVQTISYVSTLPVGTATFYESANPVAANTTATAGPVAGSATLGTATLDATGKATLPLSNLFIGTHNIYVCFTSAINKSNTQNFQPSCSASSVETVITPPPAPLITATLLRTSADPSPQGAPVTFTANVETTGAFILIPGGSVTFYDGTTSIGTATLDATGSAILTTSTLTLGTHPITVSYAGSTYIAASTSASLPEIIVDPLTAAGTGFLLQINPTTVPVFVGSTGTATIQVIALTNFNEPVELSCTGLPAQSSCIFSQSIIPVGGGTTELLLSSGAPHNCGENNPFLSTLGGNSAFSLLLLSGLTLCFARRRRKLQGIALAALLLAIPAALTGCSGSNCTDFAVKPGDYQFTITAHSTGPQNITKTQTMVMHVHL